MLRDPDTIIDEVYRSDWGRIVASLIRLVNDFDVAARLLVSVRISPKKELTPIKSSTARSAPRSAVRHPAPPKAIQPPPNPVCLRPRRRRGPVPVVIPGWPVERPVAGHHPASPGDRRPSRTRLKKRGTGSVGMPDRSKPAGAHGRRSALQDIVIPPEPSGRSGVGSGDTRGRWTVNRVPRSGSDPNSIRPPCNCTIP
jgi:hypothetical protein